MLEPIYVSEARKIVSRYRVKPKVIRVKPREAIGKVLAEPVIAPFDYPMFHRSALDGIAVNSEESRRLILDRREKISTGMPLPPRADAVVPKENYRIVGDKAIIDRPVHKRENVDPKGSDFREGDVLLEAGSVIKPNQVSALALVEEVAIATIEFTLIVIGSEIRPFGKIPDIDGPQVRGLVELYGGRISKIIRVPDRLEDIEKALLEAEGPIITTGGTSVGDRDLVPKAIEKLGELLVHGIKAKPCKPFTFSIVEGKPVFSLPGPPVACFIAADVFVGPRIRLNLGLEPRRLREKRKNVLGMQIPSKPDRRDFVRVKLEGDKLYPIGSGAGRIVTLYPADGYLEVPEDLEGIEEGELVERYDFSTIKRRKIRFLLLP